MSDIKESNVQATPEPSMKEQALSFLLGEEEFCLNILNIQEIKDWGDTTRIPGVPKHVKGVINLRGAVVPIIDLRVFCGLKPTYDESTVIVVTNINDIDTGDKKLVGLVVDAVSDVYDIDFTSIQSPLDTMTLNSQFIKGITSMNGNMVSIVDINHLIFDGILKQLNSEAA